MAGQQYSAITAQAFTSGQPTKVFLSEPYEAGQTVPSITITLGAAIVVGDDDITVTATTKKLYEGTRLDFGTPAVGATPATYKIVYLAEEADSGATTLKIFPSEVAVASGATAKVECYIPLLSVKTVNTSNQQQEITDNVCSSLETAKAISSLSGTGSFQGPKIFGDPGLAVVAGLNDVELGTQGFQVRVQVLEGFQRGGLQADCYMNSQDRSYAQNAFNSVTHNLIVNGTWKDLPINA